MRTTETEFPDLDSIVGRILLDEPLMQQGRAMDVETEKLIRRVLAENPLLPIDEITQTIDNLMSLAPSFLSMEGRAEYYEQVLELFRQALRHNHEDMVNFSNENFNYQGFDDNPLYDKITLDVIAASLGYMLRQHGMRHRKIKGPWNIEPLYSSHPIRVAQAYISAHRATNQKLSDDRFRQEFEKTYRKKAPNRRRPDFAYVIALLWHDLNEEEDIPFEQLRLEYESIVKKRVPQNRHARFLSAANRLVSSIEDLTRDGSYADMIKDMSEKLRRRQFFMQKSSDIIANLSEMEDFPGRFQEAYSKARERLLEILGPESEIASHLHLIKNRLLDPLYRIERRFHYSIQPHTFKDADKIKAAFGALYVADAINWYMYGEKGQETDLDTGRKETDFDPFLMELRDMLVFAASVELDHREHHLIDRHCRGFDMPLNTTQYNWRLRKFLNGMPSAMHPNFELDPYLRKRWPKGFDISAREYLEDALKDAAEDGSLYRLTHAERGEPFDGLIDRYLGILLHPSSKSESRKVKREINSNKTLQYMLVTALREVADFYRENPGARFNWGDSYSRAEPPAHLADAMRNGKK